MSLLQKLSYKEYKLALSFTLDQCERIAKLAGLNITLNDTNKPGEVLIKALDRRGFTLKRYQQLLSSLHVKTVLTYYKPKSKVAILVANDRYKYLSNLATPSLDCDSIADRLVEMEYIVIKIKNTESKVLKEILNFIFDEIPEDSHCFIFYAGHGCQICNTKFMLGIDCPTENIQLQHCVSENYVLKQMERCQLDLCVFIMDMCRIYLDRETNPQIYLSITSIEDYSVHNNLIITYSAHSSQTAYEELQIECSTIIDNDVTYVLKSGDTGKIVPGASIYVNALCSRIQDDLCVSEMLDFVHKDIEQAIKNQTPTKLQCGTAKRSLYDPVSGDTSSLLTKLKEISEHYKENCEVC